MSIRVSVRSGEVHSRWCPFGIVLFGILIYQLRHDPSQMQIMQNEKNAAFQTESAVEFHKKSTKRLHKGFERLGYFTYQRQKKKH